MSFRDFPDMYALNTLAYSPRALEYILGKSLMSILQL